MILTRRHLAEVGALSLGLIGLLAWSHMYYASARRAAHSATTDLAACIRLAEEIESLQRRPALAATHELRTTEIAAAVEGAAAAANIDTTVSLTRIIPERPRRIGRTSYTETPTQVLLRQVTLAQAAQFIWGVADRAGLHAKSLRFAAPRDQENGDRWTVEVTLTYLTYAPSEER